MAQFQGIPSANAPLVNKDGTITQPWRSLLDFLWRASGGGSATIQDAQFIVSQQSDLLNNERVLQDTSTITWDFGTSGVAKASVPNLSGTNTGDQIFQFTGDVVGYGDSIVTMTLQPYVVANANMAQMPANTIKGNNTAGVGDALDLTAAQASAMIDHGLVQGLADDDHTQYARLSGRAGGQTLIGGINASDTLTITSTSNFSKGAITIAPFHIDESIGRIDASSSTDAQIMPSGTTAQRPATPLAGMVRYNTTDNRLEYHNGTTWVQL